VTQTQAEPAVQIGKRRTVTRLGVAVLAALVICAAVPIALIMRPTPSADPSQMISYLGLYERGTPPSYAGTTAFTTATGVKPDVLMSYSSWLEPFQTSFATTAAEQGAVPLMQINPSGISIAAIASGRYDGYLSSYAQAVRAYGHRVIVSFGHEMNGHWYSWGYTHTSPTDFVTGWRHIVTLFRDLGVQNVTWLWTVNIIDRAGGIPPPAPWWPGSSYVTWVGIDGYYSSPSSTFVSLFGPTITAVRELTSAPVLVAETAAPLDGGQPVKIADLFNGVRLYGLLGFVWFEVGSWRISSAAAIAAFRQGARYYRRPAS
jgi:mannan endo-1,4-beta-mannosidase